MKRILLAFALTASLFTSAQHNWQTIESNGFSHNAQLWRSLVFQNNHIVLGDTMGTCIMYSSPTGAIGSYSEIPGLGAAMQPANENYLQSATSDNNYIFMGSQTWFDTTGGATGAKPQVYRYDGVSFTKHGSLGFNPSQNYTYLSVGALALYSPTGSNDTVYAFVQSNFGDYLQVWKASANQANPTWDSVTTFSGSGITTVYDAKVWHKKLYITTGGNGVNGNMILRTADGANWDTVATGLSLIPALGINSINNTISSLEIYRDTLIAGVAPGYSSGNGVGLIYTADSLATTQNWNAFLDSAHFNNLASTWSHVNDMQVVGPNLFVIVNLNSYYSPSVYMITKNTAGRDTILTSSTGSIVENYTNSGDIATITAMGNHVLVTTHYAMASRLSSGAQQSMGSNPGEIYSFNMVNPTAAFIDSVWTGGGFCENNTIYLVNTSQNASSYEWFMNGAHYSWSQDTIFNTGTAGTYTFEMVAYNGTYQSTFKDSVTNTITVFPSPMVGTMSSASSYTICQGQTDSLFVSAVGGTPPYTYTWHNVPDQLTYPGSDTTIITLYVVPSPSPYVIVYPTMVDAHMCTWGNPPPPLNIYVNPSDSLSGMVVDTNLNPVMAGKVYLFKLNPLNPQPGDTIAPVYTLGASGAYSYPSLLYGSYIAKAEADTSNPLYKTAVGTYYSNRVYPFQWDSALVIQHHSCVAGNVAGNDIKILQISAAIVAGGPGTISGQITYDSSYTGARLANGGWFHTLGAPLKGVDVKLGKNPGGSPAARTTTDTTGHYTFPNVPLGSYKIYVDIPNYGMDSARAVTINTVTPNSVSNDYYVDSSMIHLIPVFMTNAAICQGDSIMLGGAYQMGGGVYNDTLNVNGHDSVIVTTLQINPLPTLTVTTSADTVCLGGSGAILSANGNGTSYTWSSNAGSVTTATASINPTSTDTYTVTSTLGGCPVSQTIQVVVNCAVGIKHYSASGLSVYPNPATDKLNVDVQKAGTVRLYDITGQLILEKAVIAGKNEINIGNVAAGAYEVSVNAGGVLSNTKLMISK